MTILKRNYVCRHPKFYLDFSEAVTLCALPMFHAYAFMIQLIILSAGTKAVIIRKFEEELFLRSIQDYKVRKQ
jgi:acyl-CoA synthetase (AMP-forming)/AMP-acid ligase II